MRCTRIRSRRAAERRERIVPALADGEKEIAALEQRCIDIAGEPQRVVSDVFAVEGRDDSSLESAGAAQQHCLQAERAEMALDDVELTRTLEQRGRPCEPAATRRDARIAPRSAPAATPLSRAMMPGSASCARGNPGIDSYRVERPQIESGPRRDVLRSLTDRRSAKIETEWPRSRSDVIWLRMNVSERAGNCPTRNAIFMAC